MSSFDGINGHLSVTTARLQVRMNTHKSTPRRLSTKTCIVNWSGAHQRSALTTTTGHADVVDAATTADDDDEEEGDEC